LGCEIGIFGEERGVTCYFTDKRHKTQSAPSPRHACTVRLLDCKGNTDQDSDSHTLMPSLFPSAGVSILGGLGSRPPDFGQGVVGVAGGSRRVMKYYYILSCTGSVFKSGDF